MRNLKNAIIKYIRKKEYKKNNINIEKELDLLMLEIEKEQYESTRTLYLVKKDEWEILFSEIFNIFYLKNESENYQLNHLLVMRKFIVLTEKKFFEENKVSGYTLKEIINELYLLLSIKKLNFTTNDVLLLQDYLKVIFQIKETNLEKNIRKEKVLRFNKKQNNKR